MIFDFAVFQISCYFFMLVLNPVASQYHGNRCPLYRPASQAPGQAHLVPERLCPTFVLMHFMVILSNTDAEQHIILIGRDTKTKD